MLDDKNKCNRRVRALLTIFSHFIILLFARIDFCSSSVRTFVYSLVFIYLFNAGVIFLQPPPPGRPVSRCVPDPITHHRAGAQSAAEYEGKKRSKMEMRPTLRRNLPLKVKNEFFLVGISLSLRWSYESAGILWLLELLLLDVCVDFGRS